MKPVILPNTDVNSKTVFVAHWHVAEGGRVDAGGRLVDVETSKALIEVEAPDGGLVFPCAPAGRTLPLSQPIAYLFEDQGSLAAFKQTWASRNDGDRESPTGPRATVKARELAERHGIAFSSLDHDGLITEADVRAALKSHRRADASDFPNLLKTAQGVERICLIGGGLAATQVIDIFRSTSEKRQAVGILDDEESLWGQQVSGVPVVGGGDRLGPLFEEGAFDKAVISISTSIAARAHYQQLCRENGVPMANAIDPTVRITSGVQMGSGNVICGFCYFGPGAVVGDNNFISAFNSFDHHSRVGDCISTGPGCMTSGLVKIGNRVRMGTGIFIEPRVDIGDDSQIASGSVIVRSVPPNHAVKRKVGGTVVVPRRG